LQNNAPKNIWTILWHYLQYQYCGKEREVGEAKETRTAATLRIRNVDYVEPTASDHTNELCLSLSLSLARSLSLPSRYKISACLYAIWPTRAAGCAKLGGREETADCDGKEVQLQSSGLQTKFYGSNDAKNEFKLYENCIINGNSRGGRNQKQQHLFPHLRGPQQ